MPRGGPQRRTSHLWRLCRRAAPLVRRRPHQSSLTFFSPPPSLRFLQTQVSEIQQHIAEKQVFRQVLSNADVEKVLTAPQAQGTIRQINFVGENKYLVSRHIRSPFLNTVRAGHQINPALLFPFHSSGCGFDEPRARADVQPLWLVPCQRALHAGRHGVSRAMQISL